LDNLWILDGRDVFILYSVVTGGNEMEYEVLGSCHGTVGSTLPLHRCDTAKLSLESGILVEVGDQHPRRSRCIKPDGRMTCLA